VLWVVPAWQLAHGGLGPDEGSLDCESLEALTELLAQASPDGHATKCFGYFTPLVSADFDRPPMCAFRLGDVQEVSATTPMELTPSNWWPIDRSWFVYTDWDLSATKVSGSLSLITSLTTAADLETIIWP
jgi:hypothetical protein